MDNLVQLMTDEDVMKLFDITDKRTLRKYLQQGLGYIKIGRKRKYTAEMVNSFILSRRGNNL
jgi:hypothetical protein